jgi:hypothetical protein
MSKVRVVSAWIIVGLLTALFLMSAAMKLAGGAEIVQTFERFGLENMRVVIGVGELVSALLYLLPLTSSLGVLLLSAHMGGGIVTHMSNGEGYVFQSVVLVLVWVGQYLRLPELLISFSRKR